MMSASLTLNAAELEELTGYARPGDQVAELLRLGYTRARRCKVTGRAVLERAHYEAVASGQAGQQTRPKVRQPQVQRHPPKLSVVGRA